MSNITTIREALESVLFGVLTGYTKIPNPYELEKCSNMMLKKGFGIAFGPGQNTNRVLDCQMSIEREFAVILTREVTHTEHNAQGRETVEKALFEDQKLLIAKVEKDFALITGATRATYIGDSGLEYVGLENSRYFVLVSTFATEYFETI